MPAERDPMATVGRMPDSPNSVAENIQFIRYVRDSGTAGLEVGNSRHGGGVSN